ncbi:hypothetical protein J1N35_038326 [Gossypium stocksii]|uniref:Uncharacterized protein n=1 Tax=Gossypium stocksii TaxID=47602 RepID=A0A9D3ULT6_9ROSI|nr:hypothetical protein J1N35_038326 [Gossypium stocksii]
MSMMNPRNTRQDNFFVMCSLGPKPIPKDWAPNLHLERNKFILVKSRLTSGFGFPTKWSIPTELTCPQTQSLDTETAMVQVKRLNPERTLELRKLFIVRNIFRFYLKGRNPNGWWASNLYLGISSTLRLMGESSGRDLVENVADPTVHIVVILEPPIESANTTDVPASTLTPPLTDSNLNTSRQAPHTSPIGDLYYTPPLGEVQTFFSWWKHIDAGQYSFSPFVVLKSIHKPTITKLAGSFSMSAEYGLASWALQTACAKTEAKQAESEKALLFGKQSLNQLCQLYEASVQQIIELANSVFA